MRKLAVLQLHQAGMKNAEKHNDLQNMLSYNTSTKAAPPAKAREAVSGKLARFAKRSSGRYRKDAGWRQKFQAECLAKKLSMIFFASRRPRLGKVYNGLRHNLGMLRRYDHDRSGVEKWSLRLK